MNNNFLYNVLDQIIKEASTIYVKENENITDNANDVKFSIEHEKKIEKYFKTLKDERNKKHMLFITKKVAIMVIVLTLVTTGLITSVKAIRESVAKYILKNNDDNYMSLIFAEDKSGEDVSDSDNYYIDDEIKFMYLPEGFEYDEEISYKTRSAIYYVFLNRR